MRAIRSLVLLLLLVQLSELRVFDIKSTDNSLHVVSSDNPHYSYPGALANIYRLSSLSPKGRYIVFFLRLELDANHSPNVNSCSIQQPHVRIDYNVGFSSSDYIFCDVKGYRAPLKLPITTGDSNTMDIIVMPVDRINITFAYQFDETCERKNCFEGSRCQLLYPGVARCICPAGRSGELCDRPATCNEQPCSKNSVCQDVISDNKTAFKCICDAGFEGPFCDRKSFQSSCDDSYCGGKEKGSCSVVNNSSVCTCKAGYWGSTCQHDQCDQHLCTPGSICVSNDKTQPFYRCICPPSIDGTFCEKQLPLYVNESSCKNNCINGVCLKSKSKDEVYECQCSPGYFGTYCDISLRSKVFRPDFDVCEDASLKCGTGSCYRDKSNADEYKCFCGGIECPHHPGAMSACFYEPCNGGNCIETAFGYHCRCPPDVFGLHCQFRPDTMTPPPLDVTACQGYNCGPYGACYLNEDGRPTCKCNSHFNSCQNGGVCIPQGNSFKCECRIGWQGKTCEEKNACFDNSCQHDSVCLVIAEGDYKCFCKRGWQGKLCESRLYICPEKGDKLCKHGYCKDIHPDISFRLHECICDKGYTGPMCETEINYCDDNPCENNGSCTPQVGGYDCKCAVGYKGVNCTDVVDFCESSPCKFGRCTSNFTGFECKCFDGYTGHYCETEIDPCLSNPCVANHTSFCRKTTPGNYDCECHDGYSGRECQDEINECLPLNPCKHGNCSDMLNDFQCECDKGYSGRVCDVDINDCFDASGEARCLNGASCLDGLSSFTCECLPGYSGLRCETSINYCESSPCKDNSTCDPIVGGFKCNCQPGFTGLTCSTVINECSSNPCFNNVTCEDLVDGYKCHCDPGFTGRRCGVEINECASSPCKHGHCKDLIGNFTCECHPGYSGALCSQRIDHCIDHKCMNNASCINGLDTYTCHCQPGYTGQFCEEDVNECIPNPCLHGARCIDGVGKFSCSCQEGYGGPLCADDINDCSSQPCLNAVKCIDKLNGYHCVCKDFYEGPRCEEMVDLHGACLYNNIKKEHGDDWWLDCNRCICDNGTVSCSNLWCGWKLCSDEVEWNRLCQLCEPADCLNNDCPLRRFCYDRSTDSLSCVDGQCVNMTAYVDFNKLSSGTDIERLCEVCRHSYSHVYLGGQVKYLEPRLNVHPKNLRKRVTYEKEKIGQSPVRIECQRKGNSKAIDINIRTPGAPGLAARVKETLTGIIIDTISMSTAEEQKDSGIGLSLWTKVALVIGGVTIILIILVVALIKYKRHRDARLTLSADTRPAWRKRSSQQQLVANAREAVAVINPSFTDFKQVHNPIYEPKTPHYHTSAPCSIQKDERRLQDDTSSSLYSLPHSVSSGTPYDGAYQALNDLYHLGGDANAVRYTTDDRIYDVPKSITTAVGPDQQDSLGTSLSSHSGYATITDLYSSLHRNDEMVNATKDAMSFSSPTYDQPDRQTGMSLTPPLPLCPPPLPSKPDEYFYDVPRKQ